MCWRVRKAWEWWLPVSYALAMGYAIFVLASTLIGNGGELYWSVCACACGCMCMCVHVHVCTCACVYMCMWVHVGACLCVYMCMWVHVYVCMCACVYWLAHSYYFPSTSPILYRVHVQWPCCWLPVQCVLHVCPVYQLHWQHNGGYVWTVPSTVLPGSYPATGQPWYMQRYVNYRCSLSEVFIDALLQCEQEHSLITKAHKKGRLEYKERVTPIEAHSQGKIIEPC